MHAGLEKCRRGGMHERRDAGLEGSRTGGCRSGRMQDRGIQDRRDAGEKIRRIGGIQERKEKCMK